MTRADAATVRDLANGLGFALVGVAQLEPTEHGQYFRDWLDQGKHGQMAYLAEHLEKRLDPRKLLPVEKNPREGNPELPGAGGTRSMICVADRHPYRPPAPPEGQDSGAAMENRDHQPDPTGQVARYAWGDDYHKVIKKRLFKLTDALRERWPDHQYQAAVDTAPILEREHAQRAGLGWVGKNTLLIHPRLGSWMLLGAIVTTLEFTHDQNNELIADHCGTCTRCIDACPTGCLTPYQIDAQRCISYLTIEHRDAIPPELHEPMGDWIAGCDVCQEVCPYNAEDRIVASEDRAPVYPGYSAHRHDTAMSLLDILNWDEAARRQALVGSALKRIKLDMFKRNALIAAGNHLAKHEHGPLHARVEELVEDSSEPQIVRTAASQVVKRLKL